MDFKCLLLGMILLTFSCTHKVTRKTSSEGGNAPFNQMDFRKVFKETHTELYGAPTPEEFDQLVYLPPEKLLTPPDAANAQEFMKALSKQVREVKARDLYLEGKKASQEGHELENLSDADSSLASINGALEKNPITIVIVPGILGEFIITTPFHAAFGGEDYDGGESDDKARDSRLKHRPWETSRFFKEWKSSYLRAKGNKKCRGKNAHLKYDFCERHLSLEATKYTKEDEGKEFPSRGSIGKKTVPLSSLIRISGFNQDLRKGTGKDLVQLIVLRQPRFSLESLASPEQMATIYNRRLGKIFRIMGKVPKNLVFLGYSQGHNFVLEMLYQAHKKKDQKGFKWAKNIRGTIGLGGTFYGSDLADQNACYDDMVNADFEISNKKTPACKQNKDLWKFAASLNYGNSYTEIAKTIGSWGMFLYQNLPESPSVNWWDLIWNPMKGLSNLTAGIKKLGPWIRLHPILPYKILNDFMLKSFKLNRPTSEFKDNIKRFKILAKYSLSASEALSTQARSQWWKNRNMPTKGLRYYTVSGTMVPKSDKKFYPLLVANNQFSYNHSTVDYSFLWDTYVGLTKHTKHPLNDTQMTYYKSKFWDDYTAMLNPYYKSNPIKTTSFGIMGTHHWGFAFPIAGSTIYNDINPYPRLAFIKAMAAGIAIDLNNGHIE